MTIMQHAFDKSQQTVMFDVPHVARARTGLAIVQGLSRHDGTPSRGLCLAWRNPRAALTLTHKGVVVKALEQQACGPESTWRVPRRRARTPADLPRGSATDQSSQIHDTGVPSPRTASSTSSSEYG